MSDIREKLSTTSFLTMFSEVPLSPQILRESARSTSSLDHLEATIAELTVTQLHFTATQASMASKLDALLWKMNILVTSQHSLCSFSVKSPPTTGIMPTPLPMSAHVCRQGHGQGTRPPLPLHPLRHYRHRQMALPSQH